MLELLSWLLLLLPLASAAAIQLWLKDMPDTAVRMSVFSVITTFTISLILLAGEATSTAINWASAGSFAKCKSAHSMGRGGVRVVRVQEEI